MSTNYLSLRSTVTYVSSGVQPSTGTVYTVGSNGNPAWTSTLNSHIHISSLIGSTMIGHSTTLNLLTVNSTVTTSTLSALGLTTGSLGVSTLTGSSLTITNMDASGPISIGTRLQGSVDGSNMFWTSLRGTGTEVDRVGFGIKGNVSTGLVESLSFNTNSSNRMFIASTGNVGIATTNPQALLDVRGNCFLGVNGNKYVELAADSSNASYIDFHSQDSRATDYDTRIVSNGGSSTFGQGSLEFYARNTLLKTSTIGTSAAATNSNYGLRISQVDTINSTFGQVIGQIGFEGAGRSVVSGFVRCLTDDFNGYDDAGGLAFGTSEGAGGALERVRINESGFVGVGTASPGVKLDISLSDTTAWPTGIRMLQPGATSGYGPSIVFGRNDVCYNLASLGFTYIGDGSQANYINLGVACDTTSPFQITGYGRVGIGITNPSYKLHVVGDIYASANVIAMSDQRVKRDIQPLGQTLDRLSSLNGYTYFRDGKDQREMGLIAQEVMSVFPEAVHYDKEQDRYGVNYGSLVAPLLESIKDLKKQVDVLTHKVLLQEQQITTLMSV